MDRTETVCPQLLEQLEDELLTVSTVSASAGQIKYSFSLKRIRPEDRTSITAYDADFTKCQQHKGITVSNTTLAIELLISPGACVTKSRFRARSQVNAVRCQADAMN